MANVAKRHPKDHGGAWFVDTTCIDCDVARQLAPGLILEDGDGLSYFAREPESEAERTAAWRAVLACPSGSIGAPRGAKPPPDAFPMRVTEDAYLAGYHSESSFGAHAYLLRASEGNVMIDAPRYLPAVVQALKRWGGLRHILLTHRDDVADAPRYAERFGADVWIHVDDADAAPTATRVFQDETLVQEGLRAIPFPGHTRGSAVFLYRDRLLFTGDSLAFGRRTQDLTAFRDATWFSWDRLIQSISGLTSRSFEWVLPGHGSWGHFPAAEMKVRVGQLVERMRQPTPAAPW